jgi:hypothetical protein
MRIDEVYRGYKIRYRRKKGWIANIWPPMAYFPLGDVPHSSQAEGIDALRHRVKSVIDAHAAAQAEHPDGVDSSPQVTSRTNPMRSGPDASPLPDAPDVACEQITPLLDRF